MALLINHGAEVTCKDKKGYTPLHAAASNGQINVVKHLLNLGVEVSPPRLRRCSAHAFLHILLSEMKSCLPFIQVEKNIFSWVLYSLFMWADKL